MLLSITLDVTQMADLKDALDIACEGYADKIQANEKYDMYTEEDIANMRRQQQLAQALFARVPYPPMSRHIDLTEETAQ